MLRRRAGFTLMELLVSIGIIAIIASMLAPIYVSAKRTAIRSQCQSNLSQIAKAFDLYTSDYCGSYPNTNSQYLWAGASWREPMKRYVRPGGAGHGSILSCPSDPTPPGIYSGTSYAYSACFYMTPEQVSLVADGNYLRSKFAATNPKLPCSTIQCSAVRFPTKKALAAEYWTLHSENTKVGWYDDPVETGNDPWSGERNYLFADGHVRFVPTSRIHGAYSPLVTRPRILPDINLTHNGIAGKDID